MSRSATPATRNEATRRFKPPKNTPFCRTYGPHADGCGRLHNVDERSHPQPPDPQSETGTLPRIREKVCGCMVGLSTKTTQIWPSNGLPGVMGW